MPMLSISRIEDTIAKTYKKKYWVMEPLSISLMIHQRDVNDVNIFSIILTLFSLSFSRILKCTDKIGHLTLLKTKDDYNSLKNEN